MLWTLVACSLPTETTSPTNVRRVLYVRPDTSWLGTQARSGFGARTVTSEGSLFVAAPGFATQEQYLTGEIFKLDPESPAVPSPVATGPSFGRRIFALDGFEADLALTDGQDGFLLHLDPVTGTLEETIVLEGVLDMHQAGDGTLVAVTWGELVRFETEPTQDIEDLAALGAGVTHRSLVPWGAIRAMARVSDGPSGIALSNGGMLQVYEDLSPAGPPSPNTWELPEDGGVHRLAVGDVNGDGAEDVLFNDGDWNRVGILTDLTQPGRLGESSFFIDYPQQTATPGLPPPSEVDMGHGLDAGDVDGDGQDDVVIAVGAGEQGRGVVAVFLGPFEQDRTVDDADVVFRPEGDAAIGFGGHVNVSDIDGDGVEEIIIGSGAFDNRRGRVDLFRYDAVISAN